MKQLKGVCPILPTPFDENNNIDIQSLKRMISFLLESGVSGIALFGNASEAFALTQVEKDLIADVVIEETSHRLPLVFGAGGTSAETALVSCRWAETKGADVLMIMPPHMIKPNSQGVYEYYAQIATNISTPIMIQDAPGASGVNMDVNTIVRLAKEFELIQYVKAEAPPTPLKAKAIIDALDGAAVVFGGLNAACFYEELCAGVEGTMPAGEFPEVLVKVLNLFQSGSKQEAKEVFYRYLPFIRLGNLPGGIAMAIHKEILKKGGIFKTSKVRGPFVPASDFLKDVVFDCIDGLELKALKWDEQHG